TLLHHPYDEVVRDGFAPVHVGARLDAEPTPLLHVLAQDVAGRDLGDVQALRQDPGLCPLAGAGESEEHEAHRALPATAGNPRSAASSAATRSVSSSRAPRPLR